MKYVYTTIVLIVIFFLAFHLIPIAVAIFRIILGLMLVLVFGLGVWLGTKFNKNE